MILIVVSNPFKGIDELCKKLANDFGATFKQLDDDFLLKNAGFFEESSNGNFVYTGPVIAGKMNAPATKIYLKESSETILNRIAKDKKISVENAKEIYDNKIKFEKERLTKYFGIELYNPEVYDMILKIDDLDNSSIISVIEKYVAKKQGTKKK